MKSFKEFLAERTVSSKEVAPIYEYLQGDDVLEITKQFGVEETDIKYIETRDVGDIDSYVLEIKSKHYWYILNKHVDAVAKAEFKEFLINYDSIYEYLTDMFDKPTIERLVINLGESHKQEITNMFEEELQDIYDNDEDIQEEYPSFGEYEDTYSKEISDIYDYYEELGFDVNPIANIVLSDFDAFYEEFISGKCTTKYGANINKKTIASDLSHYNEVIELKDGTLFRIDY